MSDYQLWSWALALVGMVGLYLTTKKLARGYVVGLLVQIPWFVYALVSEQYGFILSSVGFAYVNALGWYRWTRNEKTPVSDVPTTKASQETITVRVSKEEA